MTSDNYTEKKTEHSSVKLISITNVLGYLSLKAKQTDLTGSYIPVGPLQE